MAIYCISIFIILHEQRKKNSACKIKSLKYSWIKQPNQLFSAFLNGSILILRYKFHSLPVSAIHSSGSSPLSLCKGSTCWCAQIQKAKHTQRNKFEKYVQGTCCAFSWKERRGRCLDREQQGCTRFICSIS